jgi:preprotein translocase subunit SecB
MTSTNGGEAGAQSGVQPGAQPQQTLPQLNVLGQYIKDFSFENPNAPRSLAPNQAQPNINIQINVGVTQSGETDFEVTLKLEGKAESSGTVLFAFDLTFAGMFRIQNVPKEHLHALVMIECPRLLFPFAREIIATAVRNGGFAPLLLDPVDFVALYQQRVAQEQAKAAATPTTA